MQTTSSLDFNSYLYHRSGLASILFLQYSAHKPTTLGLAPNPPWFNYPASDPYYVTSHLNWIYNRQYFHPLWWSESQRKLLLHPDSLITISLNEICR
uniref:Uncharacterized protein n=1 Tax=Romanomermis culicivorax TaxID=13658 RepID=A0A915HKC9_ROMCU